MVAKREIKTRMLTKANIISMSVMLLVIIVGAVVLNFFIDREDEAPTSNLGLEQSTEALTPHLVDAAAQQGVELELSTIADDDAVAALGAGGDQALDAFISGDPASPDMLVAEQPDSTALGLVDSAVRSYVITEHIGELGGDPAAFAEAMAAAAPQVESLETPGEGMDGPAYAISMIAISLLLFALISAGSMIAMGVVEEKTSRVVEILLATIKPSQLLAGKILGVGVYGLFQIVVLGGALVGALTALGLTADIEVDVGSTLVLLIVWFLLGYSIFALLFGGFAALVSRQEEIGSVTTPLMFLLFIPFYTTMFMVPNDPDGTAVRVLSQIPVFSPFMMPVRNAFGAVTGVEMASSMAIALATVPVLVWVAGRVYRRGVLHTGGKMKLSTALRG
jgi:ABC-2 type transport system permease protein